MSEGIIQKSSSLAAVSLRRRVLEVLRGGEPAMRAAGEEFAPKNQAEPRDEYEKRMRMTELIEATSQAVEQVVGRIFSKPVKPGEDVPDLMKEWLEDADLQGHDLHEFLRYVAEDMWWTGVGLILVEMPRLPVRADGRALTTADARGLKLRPYMVSIRADDLLQVKIEKVDGRARTTLVRIREVVDLPASPGKPWEEEREERVRVYRRNAGDNPGRAGLVTCEVWAKRKGQGGAEEWMQVEQAVSLLGVQDIPLVAVPIYRRESFWSPPPFEGLAWMNVHHWRRASDLAWIEHIANVPIPVIVGGGKMGKDGAPAPLTWSASGMLELGAGATYGYFEHSGKCIGELKATQKRSEELMHAFSLQPFLRRETGTPTATGDAIRAAESQSLVLASIGALEDAIKRALGFMMEFATNGRVSYGGSVVFNRDIGIPGGTTDEGRLLLDMVREGVLTRATLWRELVRRSTLGADFAPEKEAAALRVASIEDLPEIAESEPEPELEAQPEPEIEIEPPVATEGV